MIKLDVAHKNFVKHLESEGRSGSTLVAYGKDIQQLTEFLSKKGLNLVSEVKVSHLEEFMGEFVTKAYTSKSISRKTNSTKTFFKYLKAKGHVSENVSDLLKHPKLSNKAPRILSKIEYKALRDTAKDDIRTSAMIEVLLQTGVTISELAGMKMEHVNITGATGFLFIPNKNLRESRTVPLNKVVVDSIKKYLETERTTNKDKPFLFVTKTGNPLLVRNIRATLDRFFKLAGVENVKVNDLRHTFVAHHLMQGANISQLSKIAGHKRISTTEKYLQYIVRESVEEKTELGIL